MDGWPGATPASSIMQLILPYLQAMVIDAAVVAGMTFGATVAVYAHKFMRGIFGGRK